MHTIQVIFFKSLKAKTLGLLGFPAPVPVMFYTRWGIHTMGMRTAIDVLVLDRHDRIAALASFLQPYRMWFWLPRYDRVIELPAGYINRHQLKPGQRVKVEATGSK